MEKGARQPKKGDKVVGRVLELLPSQGRVRITLKRALISSKLAVLSSPQVRAHWWPFLVLSAQIHII